MKISPLEALLIAIATAIVAAVAVSVVSDRKTAGYEGPVATSAPETAKKDRHDPSGDFEWFGGDRNNGHKPDAGLARPAVGPQTVSGTTGAPPTHAQTHSSNVNQESSSTAEDLSPALPVAAQPAKSAQTSGGNGAEKPDKDTAVQPNQDPVATLDELRSLIESARFHRNTMNRIMDGLDSDTIQKAMIMIEGMEWGPEANMLLQGLMERWGRVDPGAAINYAGALTSRRARNTAMSKALTGWSQTDARSAYQWFRENATVDPATLGMSIGDLFGSMARNDQAWAMEKVWELPSSSMKQNALRTVYKSMNEEQKRGMLEYMTTLSSGQDRAILAGIIASDWSVYRPEEAADWVASLKDPVARRAAVDRLVSNWAYDTPEIAGEWILNLPQAERWNQVNRLIDTWAKQDPVEAADWLGQFSPAPELDPAVQTLVRSVMNDDPASAMLWAETIIDENRRLATIGEVARTWSRRNPKAAREYILNSSLPKMEKQRLLRRMN